MGEANIISIRNRIRNNCDHYSILVDEKLWYVECAKCHEKIDPIYWLSMRAREEGYKVWEKNELEKHIQRLENKTRVKCSQCGTFTNIRP